MQRRTDSQTHLVDRPGLKQLEDDFDLPTSLPCILSNNEAVVYKLSKYLEDADLVDNV